MKKRILALALTLLMLLPVVPMSVSAAGDGFIVSGGEIDKDYTYSGGVLTVLSSTAITVKNKDSSAATSDCIVVKKDISANITLAGVNISTSSAPAFMIEDDSTGDVTVTLAEGTENTLNANTILSHSAGLQKNGSIDGIGKLTITGTGKLTATGGAGGAGIGGGLGGSGSNITISGGTVTATSTDMGAGIGGGREGSGSNITISGGTVTATSTALGAGIGGGDSSFGSNITISGGSVHALKGANAPNDIGGGYNGNGAVTPKNAEEHDVYLMTIPNPSNAKVYIDDKEYKPYNHSAIDEENNTNLYAYVTGAHHTVKVGTETSCYHFANNAFAECTVSNEWTQDTNGHWHACSDENCDIQHDFAEHTSNLEVAAEQFKTGVAATCQHGTQYYKSCICGAKGTETFYGTDVDSSKHEGTLGDWQMTDGEHWKEYSVCGCKANKGTHTDISPKDHKCDDCGKVISEHELNDHPYFKADCTHNGMIAHYSCMYCGKLFTDENAENEITDSDIVIPATGHDYENGECVNCGARDPEISKCKAFFLDIFKLIIRIIKDFPVWIKTLPEAFIGLFR